MATVLYEYTVRGKGHFPADMLRRDQCWPAHNEDVMWMAWNEGAERELMLLSHQEPTKDRWASFGWEVTELVTIRPGLPVVRALCEGVEPGTASASVCSKEARPMAFTVTIDDPGEEVTVEGDFVSVSLHGDLRVFRQFGESVRCVASFAVGEWRRCVPPPARRRR